jgi:hypothetical protein
MRDWCFYIPRLPRFIPVQTEEQVVPLPLEVVKALERWRSGEMAESDRKVLLAECRERGFPVSSYEFSNIFEDGVSREDAADWLLERTRRKAFELFKIEFGATARFRPILDLVDFYWPKARLAVWISGPLSTRIYARDKLKRASGDVGLEWAKSLGWLHEIPMNRVMKLRIPYYRVWHNPQAVVGEIKEKLAASGGYRRLALTCKV